MQCIQCNERGVFCKKRQLCRPCYQRPYNRKSEAKPEVRAKHYARRRSYGKENAGDINNLANTNNTNTSNTNHNTSNSCHNLHHIKFNKRHYTADFEDTIADVHGKFGQGITSTGALVARILDSGVANNILLPESHIPDRLTVERALATKGELIKDQLAKEISECSSLGLGWDKTSKFYDRTFFEVHVLAWNKEQQIKWHKLWSYVELDPSIPCLDVLMERVLEDIQDRQKALQVLHRSKYC